MTSLALVALLFAAPVYADSKVIIDFSTAPNVKSINLTPQQRTAISAALAPRYVGDDGPMNPDDGLQECADYQSMSAIKGHFSSPDNDQMLVVFPSAHCPGAHADRHGNLVLFGPSYNVIAYSLDVEADAIAKVLDIDGDGLSEVITSYTDGGQGEFSTWAETLTFKHGRTERLYYVYGEVSTTTCGIDSNTGSQYAAVFAQGNDKDKPDQYNYKGDCGDKVDWEQYSMGELKVP
jgi:hypothetical protein